MKQLRKALTPLLALNTGGDLGPLTIYRSQRGKHVAYQKAPPLSPPSRMQNTQRNKWRHAGRAWRNLPDAKRREIRLACARAHCHAPATAVFWTAITERDFSALRTIFRQAGMPYPNELDALT